MRFPRSTFLCTLLTLSFCQLFAQKYLFDAKLLTSEDGLTNSSTSSVHKDKNGYLWIGTNGGLNRYDGYNFSLYTQEENDLYSNKPIHQIKEDTAGNLWLYYFSNKGHLPTSLDKVEAIDIFNPQTGKATPFDLFFEYKAPFTLNELNNTRIIDDKSRIWLTTKSGELYLFQNGQFLKIYEQKNAFIQYVTVDNKDNIWLGYDKSITKINLDGMVQETQHLSDDLLGVWTDNNEQLWWATGDWVVENWKYKSTDKSKKNNTKIWSKEKQGTVFQLILKKGVEAITFDFIGTFFLHRSKAGYWYAQIENQLNIFDRDGQFIYNYHNHHDLVEKDLRVGYGNYFEADNNEFWLSTPLGLVKTKISVNPFKLIQGQKGHTDYRGIVEAEDGTIFFQCSGLYQFNPKNSELPEKKNLQGYHTLVYEDSIVWSGTYTHQYTGTQLDLRTKEIYSYKGNTSKALLSFAALKRKLPFDYLIGTNEGVHYLNIQQKKNRPFTQYNGFDTLKHSQVYHFHKNAKGIWLATNNGVFLMDEKEGIIRKYNTTSKDLPFNFIRHIYEAKEGVFWLATKGGGIIQWKPAQAKGQVSTYQQFTTKDGLSHNATYAIYGDDYGKLWIPSDKGLMCFDEKNHEIRTYSIKDGLPHNEFNLTAHYQAKDGTLYFGGLGGLISFHPKMFKSHAVENSPFQFTKFDVLDGNAKVLIDKTALLQRDSVISIHPTDKLLEFHFSLLDYDAPDQHEYTYKIEGYLDEWLSTESNFIRLTYLPYGSSTLRVKGKNLNTHWSSEELILGLNVLKPFYLQWWFILLSIGCLIGFIISIIRWRISHLEKNRKYLKEEVEKQTKTIQDQANELKKLDEAKTRFFSNVTHEFRTPLTLIIGPLEQMLKKQSDTMNWRSIRGILKNARHLLSLINQLLDLSKLEHGGMKIAVSHGDIVRYTKELVHQIKPLADEKKLEIHFLSEEKNWKTNFDKKKWDKIIYNLLSNAIKFTSEGKDIQIKLLKTVIKGVENIHLKVIDTGQGIDEAELSLIFNRFYQADGSTTRLQEGTGIGLALVKELVELQGGIIKATSQLGKGTSFDIQLPIPQGHNLANALQPVAITDTTLPLSPSSKPTRPKAVTEIFSIKEQLKVLIIEDNDEMRMYIRENLDPAVYEISEAKNGIEGIEKAVNIIPDLIISDVMMPGKDGFEVTQTLRSMISTSHIPIILLTAKAALESRLEGLKRGADAYLTKPFSFDELTTRIQKLIETRQLLQQRFQNGIIDLPENKAVLPFEEENEFIKEIRAIIDMHLNAAELNGAFIGQQIGMSRMQLHRKLKALINQSATELIRETRLQKAHQLLLSGVCNSAEVAYRTGFNTPAYFSSSFKKRFGFSPSDVLKEV